MSKSIDIVVHCYSEKHDCYAKMLTAQLSSIALHRPAADFSVFVCSDTEDELTAKVVYEFQRRELPVFPLLLKRDALFRRAIGRDIAGRHSHADIVWWADCDLLFGEGCLDALAASEFTGLAFPRTQLVHRAHWIGDRDLTQIVPGEIWKPNPNDFEPNKIKFASGGFIIVDGDTARKGFLTGTHWTEPVDPKGGFRDPREDITYRKSFNGQSTVLNLPQLYRFRHSACPFQSAEDRLSQTAHVK